MTLPEGYVDNVVWSTEGWRTAAVTCEECGVSLILSRTVDVMAVHTAWHGRVKIRKVLADED